MVFLWSYLRRGTCAAAFALALSLTVRITSAQAESGERVVVLRSGGVLAGVVSTKGERYEVTRPNSVVDIEATQVLLIADSMVDAYERQRQQLPREVIDAHVGLAEWCLRYNLVEPAGRELADARRLDPRDPRVGLLERRLAVMQVAKSPAVAAAIEPPHEETSAKDELKRLEADVADLPPGTIERFTRKVQPLLVNSCTLSGCHRPGGAQDFQLDRAVLHGLANRRITLRNLVAALELVDHDTPQQSDLLTIPRAAHGGMKRPVLSPRQEAQLDQLADFVSLVTESSVGTKPLALADPPNAQPIQPAAPWNARDKSPRIVDRRIAPAAAEREEIESLLPDRPNQFGLKLKTWEPKDEFDPEIFNRQQERAQRSNSSSATRNKALAPSGE